MTSSLCPDFTCDNSPALHRWGAMLEVHQVPKGRPNVRTISAVPSVLIRLPYSASDAEAPGYCQASLRDKGQQAGTIAQVWRGRSCQPLICCRVRMQTCNPTSGTPYLAT